MPFAKCPKCSHLFHVKVDDIATWYRERHPEARLGDLVSEECLYCRKAAEKAALTEGNPS